MCIFFSGTERFTKFLHSIKSGEHCRIYFTIYYGIVTFGGDILGSLLNFRSSQSSSVIVAYWLCGDCYLIIIHSNIYLGIRSRLLRCGGLLDIAIRFPSVLSRRGRTGAQHRRDVRRVPFI